MNNFEQNLLVRLMEGSGWPREQLGPRLQKSHDATVKRQEKSKKEGKPLLAKYLKSKKGKEGLEKSMEYDLESDGGDTPLGSSRTPYSVAMRNQMKKGDWDAMDKEDAKLHKKGNDWNRM